MKLHPDQAQATSIQAYGPGWIAVNGERIRHSVVLGPEGKRRDWGCHNVEQLKASHFSALLELQPELVIFGSGNKLRFVHPSLYAALMQQRVGLETMDTQAACRTFNILSQEGRRVVAALLIEPLSD